VKVIKGVFVSSKNNMAFASMVGMIFIQVWKVPSFLFKLLESRLLSWEIPDYRYLGRLLPAFMSPRSCSLPPSLPIMDERAERLEALKTLHETRANDQYG